MARYGRGLVCLPMTGERLDELRIPLMVQDEQNSARFGTAFCVPIEARKGTTTGISAADRAKTVLAAIDPRTKPEDLARPGHMFPLRARSGGVLQRAGQTEAAVDLARLCGPVPGRRHLRGDERGRDDGARAAARGLLPRARHPDDHDPRPHPVPDADRAARPQDRRGEPADLVRRLPRPRLREPDRPPAPRGAGDGRGPDGGSGARPRPLAVPDRRHLLVQPLRLRRPAPHGARADLGRGPRASCST